MKPHEYQPDFDTPPDPYRIARLCKCGLPKRNRAHDVPPNDEGRTEDERRLGER